ncbi:MAG: AAA family ATPase [Bradymonadaceae bacterium]
MLERLEVQNFRCLRDVSLELEPLTILVGPNASGKSTLLDALDSGTNYRSTADTWQHKNKVLEIKRNFVGKNENFLVPSDSSGDSQYEGLRQRDLQYQLLQFDLKALRQSNEVNREFKLRPDGANLSNVFFTLSRDTQIALRDEFCELVPVYDDVDVEPVRSGSLELRFSDRWSEVEYRPHHVSDGTMLMLSYLLLQYQEDSPDVVAIEEPERGLHPYLLEQLVQFFRSLAEGRRGPEPFRIVLATHSAQLLEYAEAEEIRLLDRDSETGETVIDKPPVDDPNWEETLETYLDSLGHAWLSGGLGGVPGRR